MIPSNKSQKLIQIVNILKAADHEGYHHSAYDWWIFDARMTSPKTCALCQMLDMTDWRGDWIAGAFPYHVHERVNAIKALVHPNCRCRLRWAGRAREIYESPLGFDALQTWQVSKPELDRLTPNQLGFALEFLRNPFKLERDT